ncbi:MAG: MFS transporter [Sinobacteraceae bacterium]|nr:MFS transporter [Nevskiaceae bacterium]
MPPSAADLSNQNPAADEGRVIHGNPEHVSPSDIAIGVIVGRASEYFDFFVFAIASVIVFPQVFFPFVDARTGMAYSFSLFALAFVARPFGAWLFRLIHDRYGRNVKLTIALFALGTMTAGIAFLPSYDSMGVWAIALLAAFRFGQGLAVGGSWDGLPSLLALNAPNGRRGTYAAIAQLGAPLGFIIASALFAYLWLSLSSADFLNWAWRYPFFVAFALNVVALFARIRLVATPEYSDLLKTQELTPAPLGELLRTQWRNILLGGFAPLASFALFHLVTVFALAWAVLFTTQSVGGFLIVQLIGACIAVVTMLAAGRAADHFGRRKTLLFFAVLVAIFSGWTALLLAGSVGGGYLFVLIGFALLGAAHGQAAGAINSVFASRFRYSGAIITSDLAWLFGAAFAPLIALELAVHLGIAYVGLYLLSGALGTFAALRVNHNLEMRAEIDPEGR